MGINQKVNIKFAGYKPSCVSEVNGIITSETYSKEELSMTVNIPINPNLQDKFGQTGELPWQTKDQIEVQRYKQDCRKRALDLSHQESFKSLSQHDIIKEADKYYNWLISIPEK